ncbi:MAG: LCP family protein [Pelosinus sp.]|nr:LCP family protein [Pelosinus sp.]
MINGIENNDADTPRRRLRKGRVVVLVLSLMIMAVGVGYALGYLFFGEKVAEVIPAIAKKIVMPKGKINVLVLGVDERQDDVGRSDTAILVDVDYDAKRISVLSIPRDSWAKIPGHNWDKINHAYAFGGMELSHRVVENLLGIPVDYTVAINSHGLAGMIDALGGVTIDVEKRMYYSDPYDDDGGLFINLKPGVQRMDGKTALQYVRYRDEEGDIGRVARQQKFLKAVMQELLNPQVVLNLPGLIKEFATAVKTDMPISEMLKLAKIGDTVAKAGLNTYAVDGVPVYIKGVSYWIPNIGELRQDVAAMQGISADSRYNEETNLLAIEYEQSLPKGVHIPGIKAVGKDKLQVEVINANGQSGLASKVAQIMGNRGFVVAGISNAAVQKNTVVILHGAEDFSMTDKLSALPFKFELQTDNDHNKKAAITVIIGLDYTS